MVRTGSERQVRRGPDGVEGTAEDRFGAEPGGNIRLFYFTPTPAPLNKAGTTLPVQKTGNYRTCGAFRTFPANLPAIRRCCDDCRQNPANSGRIP